MPVTLTLPQMTLGRPTPPLLGATGRPLVVLHTRVVAGSGGGPEKTIFRSARFGQARGVHVAAAYLHPHGDPGMTVIREHAARHGCPLYEIGETGPVDPRAVRSMYQLCRKLRVDVWHAHDYKSNMLGLLLRRLWPMTLVTTAHGWTWDTRRTRLYYHVDRFCLPHYDHVFAVSPKLVDQCRQAGVKADRLTYLPNGIDTAEFMRAVPRDQARRELGIRPEAMVLGVVGRLSVEKGVDRAIPMLARLRRIVPTAELHLVGDGPQRAHLESLAREHGVGDAVCFRGWQKDSRPIYEAMDMLLLPSLTEGMPNVVLEAMAMGVPVAATDVGAVRELLDEGRCGHVLDGDAARWHLELAHLLQRPEMRGDMVRHAHRRVEQHYGLNLRMSRELEVYDAMFGREALPLRRAA